MKEAVVLAKEADAKKDFLPTKSDNSIHRLRDEPERQLGSLRGVIGNIRRDGGTPSVECIAAELSSTSSAQRAPALLALQQTHGNRYVQRVVELAMKGEGETEVTPELEEAIQRARGGGQILDKEVRGQMESAFGADFSGVRVHTDVDADTLNRSLNARAFTTGQDIFFRKEEYGPQTSSGRELIAHELVHVIQQGHALTQISRASLQISDPSHPAEKEAERIAKVLTYQKDEANHSKESSIVNSALVQGVQRTPDPHRVPSAAAIPDLRINTDPIIAALRQMSRGNWLSDDIDWDAHPVTDEIRTICGSDYFRGSNFWSSGWVDDEWPDWISLGLTDLDVKVDLTLMVDNETLVHRGAGQFTSESRAREERRISETTSLTGEAEAAAGGHEGAPSAGVTLGAGRTTSSGRTMQVGGGSRLTMEIPALARRGEAYIRVQVHFNPTLGSAWHDERTPRVGTIVYGEPAGSTGASR